MKNKFTNHFLTIFLLSSSVFSFDSKYSSLLERIEKLEEESKEDTPKTRSFVKNQQKTIDELREQIKNLENTDQIIPSFINSTLIAGAGICSFVFGIIISHYFSTKS